MKFKVTGDSNLNDSPHSLSCYLQPPKAAGKGKKSPKLSKAEKEKLKKEEAERKAREEGEHQILDLIIMGDLLGRYGVVVSALDFKSEGGWFDAQSMLSCCFLRQETLPHIRLSPPRCINGYWSHTAGGNPAMD